MHLRHGPLTARIDALGAELRSLRLGDEEYLWQDESKVWPHSAPILFPFVGRLNGGGFEHQGRFHDMPIHGFAARELFELIEQRDDTLLLQLRAHAGTRSSYPFDFRLRVRFTLDDVGLEVSYEVRNDGLEELPFSLGSHPGFALRGPLEDWQIEFEQDESPEVYRLDGDLLASAPTPWRFDARRITLSAALFADDALIFKNIRSRRLRLVHRQRGERLSMDTGGAPHLGLWARAGAAYVCIEPWFGVDEDRQAPRELAAKPGLIRLAPQQRFEASYRIAISG